MISRRNLLLGAATVTLGGGLSTVGRSNTPVILTCGANIAYTNLFVAEAAGLFTKHGVDGKVMLFDVAFAGTEAVLGGQANTSATAEAPLIGYLSKGADLVIPCTTYEADDLKIVCVKDITGPADLAGKTIGILKTSAAHYGLERFLLANNVPLDSVNLVNVPAAEQVALFIKGDIQAYVWLEPMVSKGLEGRPDDAHVLTPGLETVMKTRTYLQALRSWADANGEALEGVIAALVEAGEMILTDRSAIAGIVASKLRLQEEEVSRLLAKGTWDWTPRLDARCESFFTEISGWLKAQGRINTVPDIKKALYPAPLRKIRSDLVTGF